jgi:hypothetical protein
VKSAIVQRPIIPKISNHAGKVAAFLRRP